MHFQISLSLSTAPPVTPAAAFAAWTERSVQPDETRWFAMPILGSDGDGEVRTMTKGEAASVIPSGAARQGHQSSRPAGMVKPGQDGAKAS